MRLAVLGLCMLLLLAGSGIPSAAAAPAIVPPDLASGWSYQPPLPSQPQRLGSLPEVLQSIIREPTAHWGIGVRDLTSGETVALNAAQRFPSASLYKLGVLVEVEQRLADGRLRPDTPLVVSSYDLDPVFGGSYLDAGDVLSIDQALDWMITRSDNGAAIALVRELGGGAVINARFRALRMWQSIFDDEAWTSPADQLHLFSELAAGRVVSSQASAAALMLLAHQRVNDRIPRGLPAAGRWIAAHKTGDSDDVIADSGIVATPSAAYVLTLMADRQVVDADVRLTFAALSAAVYDTFEASAPDPHGGALFRLLENQTLELTPGGSLLQDGGEHTGTAGGRASGV